MLNIPFEFDKDKVPDLIDLLPSMPVDMFVKVADQNESVSLEEEEFLEKVRVC